MEKGVKKGKENERRTKEKKMQNERNIVKQKKSE